MAVAGGAATAFATALLLLLVLLLVLLLTDINTDTDFDVGIVTNTCLLYTSPSPRDKRQSRMPSSA